MRDLPTKLAAAHPDLRFGLLQHEGHDWLELATTIGPADAVSPYDLLLHNIDLLLGQLCVIDGVVVLLQTLPLDGIVPEVAFETAQGLVREAQHLRTAFRAREPM